MIVFMFLLPGAKFYNMFTVTFDQTCVDGPALQTVNSHAGPAFP